MGINETTTKQRGLSAKQKYNIFRLIKKYIKHLVSHYESIALNKPS